jgi:hypothetical protein
MTCDALVLKYFGRGLVNLMMMIMMIMAVLVEDHR